MPNKPAPGTMDILLSVRVTVAMALFLSVLIIMGIYLHFPCFREHLKFLIALVGGTAVLYSGIYAGISLRVSEKRSQQDRAFEILRDLNQTDVTTVRTLIETEITSPVVPAPQALYDKIMNDPSLLKATTSILGLYEDTSIAIQENYASEEVLYKSLRFQIPWIYGKLKPYIEHEQTQNDETIYCETQKLVAAWTKGNFLSNK